MIRLRVTHVESVTREIVIDVPDSVSADEYDEYVTMQCFHEGRIFNEDQDPHCETLTFAWAPIDCAGEAVVGADK